MRRTRSLSPLIASLGAVLAISAARADTVGTAGAVNTVASGTLPAGPTRVLEIGAQVVSNEKIQTTASGSVQVLFIDKTTLNVGPNSTLVIDRFVYNPATTNGQLALSLGKGVVRVVGGVATHSEGATIRTPVAAIGLRGGIAIISHNAAKGTQAILGFGHMSVTTLCVGGGVNCTPNTVQVSRPGFGVTVAGFNKSPSSPGRASSEELAKANGQLTSKGGQSGGASQQPTDSLAVSYNVGTPNGPGSQIVAITGNSARGVNALQVLNTTAQISQTAAQNTSSITTTQTFIAQQLANRVTPPPVTPPPGMKPPPPPAATYAIVTPGPFNTSPGGKSPVPYLTGAFAGTGGFTVSPILGYQTGGLNPDGTPDTTSRQFQAGLSVVGKGARQNATIFVMTSAIANAPHIGFTQAGGFFAATVHNTEGWYGGAGGAVSSATQASPSNTVQTMNGLPVAGFTLNNTATNLDTGQVTNSQSSNFVKNAFTNYTFNPVNTGTPTTMANNHPTLGLAGYVGGVMATASGGVLGAPATVTTPYVVTNVTGQPGDVGIFLPGTSSEMLAVFNVKSVGAPAGAMTTSNYIFGSLDAQTHTGLNGARGAYVNPSNFAGLASAIFNNGANVPISLRNGQVLGSIPGGSANQLMVTADSVGANTQSFLTSISTVPAGGMVQPCNCESTKWGFWSAFNRVTNSEGQLVFEDQGPLLLWVAGVPTTAGALPASGTATYTGHAIASIAANPLAPGASSYLAAGTFSNTVNFGTQRGAVAINGLDGSNYGGSVALNAGTVNFGGVLSAMAGPGAITNGRTATLAGSFFQGGPTSKISGFGEMGGSLILNGLGPTGLPGGYLGSGVFAARNFNGVQPAK
jgi:FecR protein